MKKLNFPPYTDFPILSDQVITLNRIQDQDLESIIEICFYDGVQARTKEQAKAMQEKIDTDYQEGNSIHWGIKENKTLKIVGTCGYYRGFKEAGGELGCILLPEFRGAGFMRSALKLAIDYGKDQMNLKRIWALTSKENMKAIQLLESLNFEKIRELQNGDVEFEVSPCTKEKA